jgi:hypothetical protein
VTLFYETLQIGVACAISIGLCWLIFRLVNAVLEKWNI